MESPTSDSRHDRMAVRLSVIISRLLSGETLVLKSLSEEFASLSALFAGFTSAPDTS